MKWPGVSMVMTAYNAENEIVEAMDSFTKQEYSGKIELIIVNDCSKDNTAKKVFEYSKKHRQVVLVDNKKNKGLAASLNEGIKKARYEVIIPLQQDLRVKSTKWVESLVLKLTKGTVAVISPIQIPEELWETYDFWHKAYTLSETKPIKHLIGTKANAIRKKDFEKVGFFNDRDFATAGEDFDLYFKLKDMGKVDSIDEVTFHMEGNYRDSFKNQMQKQFRQVEAQGALFRMHGWQMYGVKLAIIKTALVILLIVPPFNPIGFLGLFAMGLAQAYKASKRIRHWKLLLLPFGNMIKYTLYVIAFWKGYFQGKQTFRSLS